MRKYFDKLMNLLKSKRILFFLLLILLIITFLAEKTYNRDRVLKYSLVLFVFSFVVQILLLWKKRYMFYIFRLLLLFLIGFQIAWIVKDKKMCISYDPATLIIKSPVFGFRTRANVHESHATALWENDTIYHYSFSTDSLGRRISGNNSLPADTVNEKNKKHALFLGCSVTFGQGINYTSTFPYLFEQLNPDYTPYNYGIPGFGPHQMAFLFDKKINIINHSTIKEQNGFALYTYIDDHLNRVAGGSASMRWGHYIPDISVGSGQLIVNTWPKKRLLLAKILNNVGMAQILGIQLTYPHDEEFYKRFANIISYMAKKYWKIYPQNDFYVGIYPIQHDLAWVPYLDPRIKVLQVAEVPDYRKSKGNYTIPHDGHPTGELNTYYVEEIMKLMK
jgi:hypothetical protein